MADLTYNVLVNLSASGLSSFGGHLTGATASIGMLNRAASDLTSTVRTVAGGLTGAFEGAVESAVRLGATVAAVGAVGAFAAIAGSVSGLNSKLEETQISLATIFTANGISSNMTKGLGASAILMDQMRRDAADLPGEFKDLVNIFQMAAMPGLRAGLSANQLEKMSSQVMAAAAASGVEMPTAAREFGMLLGGRAGAHNVLGMKVFGLAGQAAKDFNELDAAKRVEFLSKGFEKFAPAIEVYKNSFIGLSSTLKDNFLRLSQAATAPIFERVKEVLKGANKFFDENKTEVMHWANMIGDALSDAFDTGLKKIREWYPYIKTFAISAFHEIEGVWRRIEPIVAKVANHLKFSLGDGSALAMLGKIAGLYGASKATSALGGIASLVPSPSTLMMLEGAGGGIGAGGAGASLTSLLANPASLAVVASAIVGIAGALTVSYGIFTGLNSSVSFFNESMQGSLFWISEFSTKVGTDLVSAFETAKPAIDDFSQFFGANFLNTLTMVAQAAAFASGKLNEMSSFMMDTGRSVAAYVEKELRGLGINADLTHRGVGRGESMMNRWGDRLPEVLDTGKSDTDKILNKTLDAVAGRAGTHIQKVEIVVTSNQDPSRIARLTVEEIKRLGQFAKSSRGALDVTRGRP